MSNQGWICPKCERVFSPTTVMCFKCDPVDIKESSNTSSAVFLSEINVGYSNI